MVDQLGILPYSDGQDPNSPLHRLCPCAANKPGRTLAYLPLQQNSTFILVLDRPLTVCVWNSKKKTMTILPTHILTTAGIKITLIHNFIVIVLWSSLKVANSFNLVDNTTAVMDELSLLHGWKRTIVWKSTEYMDRLYSKQSGWDREPLAYVFRVTINSHWLLPGSQLVTWLPLNQLMGHSCQKNPTQPRWLVTKEHNYIVPCL